MKTYLKTVAGKEFSVLSVRDSGCGIAADVQKQIFDFFFTTKKSGQGTGLGLSMSKNIVERFGGHIEVQSEVGAGSEFSVWIPCEAKEGAVKVLIVDDEDLIRSSLRRAFEMRHHSVLDAANGQEGLEIWRKNAPDLVILDVLMPNLTGPQVLANIGDVGSTKVILVSAYTGEYDVKRAVGLGATLFLPKPFHNVFDVVDRAEKLVKNSG